MSFKRKTTTREELVEIVIDNSDDLAIGDGVKSRNGNLEKITAGDALSGIIVDVVDKNGNSLLPEKGSIANIGSASITSGVITVASDNETVDLIAARIDISKQTVYSADVTGTIGTTVTSNKWGVWVDCDDEDSIDETTSSRTVTDKGQFLGRGTDPDDSTRLLVSIAESEIYDSPGVLS